MFNVELSKLLKTPGNVSIFLSLVNVSACDNACGEMICRTNSLDLFSSSGVGSKYLCYLHLRKRNLQELNIDL